MPSFPGKFRWIAFACLTSGLATAAGSSGVRVFQATGIKLSDPTTTSVIVWTRVTRDPDRAADDGPRPIIKLFRRDNGNPQPLRDNATYSNARPVVEFPAGADWGSIRGAAIGAPGQTQVRYRPAGVGEWAITS